MKVYFLKKNIPETPPPALIAPSAYKLVARPYPENEDAQWRRRRDGEHDNRVPGPDKPNPGAPGW